MIMYLHELKRNRKSFIIWTVIALLLIVSQMVVFPSFYEDSVASQAQLINKYPEMFVETFGLNKLDMSNILNYFSIKLVPLVGMIGGIFAMLLGSGILSREINEKTIEFLLSKPVSRKKIVTSKLLCTITEVIMFNVILALATLLLMEKYKESEYSIKMLFLVWIALFLLDLAFSVLGLFISVFITKPKSIYSISIIIVIGSYFLSVLSTSSKKTEGLKYLSFFAYSDVVALLANGTMQGVYLICYAVVIVTCSLFAYLFFNKKRISV